MSLSEMFSDLGAPLNNVRWSWGGVRSEDGTVFLRVWQDGTKKIDGKRYIWVSYLTPPSGNLGANERLEQIKLVEAGAPCFMVMCQAVDTKADQLQVQSFNTKEVFKGGQLILIEDSYWIEVGDRVRVKSVLL